MNRRTIATLAAALALLASGCGSGTSGDSTSSSRSGDGLAENDLQTLSQLKDDVVSDATGFTDGLEICRQGIAVGDLYGTSECLKSLVDGGETASGQVLPGKRADLEKDFDAVGDFVNEVHAEAVGTCLTAVDELDKTNSDARLQWERVLNALVASTSGQYPDASNGDVSVSGRFHAAIDRVLKDCAD